MYLCKNKEEEENIFINGHIVKTFAKRKFNFKIREKGIALSQFFSNFIFISYPVNRTLNLC